MYRNQLQHWNPETSPESRVYRARAIANDVAGLRLQGVEPVPDFFGIAERYVAGELSADQFRAAIDDLRHQKATLFPPPPELPAQLT